MSEHGSVCLPGVTDELEMTTESHTASLGRDVDLALISCLSLNEWKLTPPSLANAAWLACIFPPVKKGPAGKETT